MTTDRPKRKIIRKRYDVSDGMPWCEERLVQKVLFLSLKEFRAARRTNTQGPHRLRHGATPRTLRSHKAPNMLAFLNTSVPQSPGDTSPGDTSPVECSLRQGPSLLSTNQRRGQTLQAYPQHRHGSRRHGREDLASKRPKLQAQRKFAHCPPSSPGPRTLGPRSSSSTRDHSSFTSSCLTRRRLKTEDFLSFLCLRGSVALPNSMAVLARRGLASRPLRRLGVALLIRGAAEIASKQRYGLCPSATSSFTPRKPSLRERKMREGKGEGKQRKRGKGGKEKREVERIEGRKTKEPVRVLRPRQLSLQVAMVTGLSDQHTSYVLQAPSIKSKSTNSSRRSGPYPRESKTTLPRGHRVGMKHNITRRNLKTYSNHRMPQNQHGACNHRIASDHSKLRNLTCSQASGGDSPRTPVKTSGPNRMLYANPAANSSAIRQQNQHASEHSGVLRLSRRMRGLPPDTGLNVFNAIFPTPNNNHHHPRNCKIQQHKDSNIRLHGIQRVNQSIQERLEFGRKDARKETRHSDIPDGAAALAPEDCVRHREEVVKDMAWTQEEGQRNGCAGGTDGDVGEVNKDGAGTLSEDNKNVQYLHQCRSDGQEVTGHMGKGNGSGDKPRSGKTACVVDERGGSNTPEVVFGQDHVSNSAEEDNNIVPSKPAREKTQPAPSTRTITRAAVAKANVASATVTSVTYASVDLGKKTLFYQGYEAN
ncbi:hypothetical protein NHX12_001521 [Muraenolepis orangiensis]|uniref:Protein Jumonji n=1 Tax=Muraenolepis orangiensis TaxID=630683 RepID=A0A9Q0E293_9TELE|nr:hypothetical protein NHX12_001521 [Muraenolepis orangiensis]